METQDMIVETCQQVLETLAEKENVPADKLGIRIDLAKQKAKPVLGLFNGSQFIRKTKIGELAKAGGAGMFAPVIGMSIRNIVNDLFKHGVREYELNGTVEMFLWLHLTGEDKAPAMVIYVHGQIREAVKIADMIQGIEEAKQ